MLGREGVEASGRVVDEAIRRAMEALRIDEGEELDAKDAYQKALKLRELVEHSGEQLGRNELEEIAQREQQIAIESEAPFAFTTPIIRLRFYFEFIVLPVVGLFAIAALLIRAL